MLFKVPVMCKDSSPESGQPADEHLAVDLSLNIKDAPTVQLRSTDATQTLQRDHRALHSLMLLLMTASLATTIAGCKLSCTIVKVLRQSQWLMLINRRPTVGREIQRRGQTAHLHKDALGIGAGHAMHAIKGKLEVWAAQQR